MGEKKAFKRKKYLIRKGFQLAYVGKILLLEVIAVATTALMMSYIFLYVFNDSAMVSSGPWGKGILWSTIFLAIVLMIVLFYLGIRISHRIAGPMYRFEETFKQVQQGNLNARIYLRENDEMKPLANAFNKMLDAIKEFAIQRETGEYNTETIHQKLKDVMAAIGNSELPAPEKDKYRKVLEGLQEKIR